MTALCWSSGEQAVRLACGGAPGAESRGFAELLQDLVGAAAPGVAATRALRSTRRRFRRSSPSLGCALGPLRLVELAHLHPAGPRRRPDRFGGSGVAADAALRHRGWEQRSGTPSAGPELKDCFRDEHFGRWRGHPADARPVSSNGAEKHSVHSMKARSIQLGRTTTVISQTITDNIGVAPKT